MTRLRKSHTTDPGFSRRRQGRGFIYLDHHGRPLRDPPTVERIRELVIPPAWSGVWICRDPEGHLQAVGTDSAGRKQYLYHPRWRERRDQAKFDRMVEFARALPRLRKAVAAHVGQSGFPKDRVAACAVRLLDVGFFRIGSESYAADNETFGLATMRRQHVSANGSTITFDYPAKGRKRRVQEVVDPDVASMVKALKRRRGGGPELLAYKEGGRWRDLKSPDINEYIQSVTGREYTAKDFRTWNATVIAAMALASSAEPGASPTSRKRSIREAVKDVAGYLGNTPAVSRGSYIDPRVFDRFESGVTISVGTRGRARPHRAAIERAVLDLLSSGDVEEAA